MPLFLMPQQKKSLVHLLNGATLSIADKETILDANALGECADKKQYYNS